MLPRLYFKSNEGNMRRVVVLYTDAEKNSFRHQPRKRRAVESLNIRYLHATPPTIFKNSIYRCFKFTLWNQRHGAEQTLNNIICFYIFEEWRIKLGNNHYNDRIYFSLFIMIRTKMHFVINKIKTFWCIGMIGPVFHPIPRLTSEANAAVGGDAGNTCGTDNEML